MTQPAPLPETFEAAVSELENIVRQMEAGKLPLEQALEQYRRGVALLRHCQEKLDSAEQQVKILEGNSLAPFPNAPGTQGGAHDGEPDQG